MPISRKHTLLLRNILWAALIFILCSIPSPSVPKVGISIPHMDKVFHFTLFFIMALLLYGEFHYQTKLRNSMIFLVVILCCALYGGVIEILQETHFNRSGDWWDWISDILGAISGCLFYPFSKKIKTRLCRLLKKRKTPSA